MVFVEVLPTPAVGALHTNTNDGVVDVLPTPVGALHTNTHDGVVDVLPTPVGELVVLVVEGEQADPDERT